MQVLWIFSSWNPEIDSWFTNHETLIPTLNQLSPSYETLHECGTTSNLLENTKLVLKVMSLFDDVIIFQGGYWSYMYF